LTYSGLLKATHYFYRKLLRSRTAAEGKMEKNSLQDIQARLKGFPEERVPDLIDYIETQMQSEKSDIDQRMKTIKQEDFPEAGP
jgi:uncharacterized protein YeeX (DUF496 family)